MSFPQPYSSLKKATLKRTLSLRQQLFRRLFRSGVSLFCLLGLGITLLLPMVASAQTPTNSSQSTVIKTFPLPSSKIEEENAGASASNDATIQEASSTTAGSTLNEDGEGLTPTYEYRLPFNRDASVGNRIRLEGVYSDASMYFSRPRNWDLTDVKVQIKLRHSPSLIPEKSNLVVRMNDTSIGSVPLDRSAAEVAQFLFDIPANLIQDENFLNMEVEHNTSETCTNPNDPALWTEILPDSEFLFKFKTKNFMADFNQYPYPFFDDLSLDDTKLAYLRPKTYSEKWLTTAARYQASIGRLAEYRPLTARLVNSADDLDWNERLVVIGTPAEQSILTSLDLPFSLSANKLLDGDGNPLKGEVGILAQTADPDTGNPILVATGNSEEGVQLAIQFLVQSQEQTIGAGQALLVESLAETTSPDEHNWPGYLPQEKEFVLSALQDEHGNLFEDTTVRGTNAPPVRIDFRALPDSQFSRGSNLKLHYSHTSQINPRTSSIEVILDDVTIGSKPLSTKNHSNQTYQIDLPPHLMKPDSELRVQFTMNPQDSTVCGMAAQKQLWGTLHNDTSFQLSRYIVAQLPDLELFRVGYPFTAPQDLSKTAIALPDNPSQAEIETLLALSGRLGKLSKAESIELNVYKNSSIPGADRSKFHWVGIGLREQFPFSEAFNANGFRLFAQFRRQWKDNQIQSIQDNEGVIKAVLSPWSNEHILLALSAQTEAGLREVQDALDLEPLFLALNGDTTLIGRKVPNPSPYDRKDYNMRFLDESAKRQIVDAGVIQRSSLFLENHWWTLPIGIIIMALPLYSISQLYLNRLSDPE
ncbi:cellulose biosynthesis cyclic di-GMP-binding regulatory protein BcsB [Leptolyngbyaceae cyanobacterium CCMR0081]|uniref:Cellulose biosynthesis cyclic di-GMP-binding regulatory protein BcsB n=2 Tax=Adonisia TaxID=2950183 RepID=A0A6M0RWZ1_9CYAN|nr:cellulose biosynthesis cyclic di-GMP-binding regulatory protein BcsB [Adonisia turfae CCMR0081]